MRVQPELLTNVFSEIVESVISDVQYFFAIFTLVNSDKHPFSFTCYLNQACIIIEKDRKCITLSEKFNSVETINR